MPGTTTHGYPYPLPSEAISGAAQAIKDMADTCNTKAAISASGKTTMTVSNAASASISVTYPSGRFTAVPNPVGIFSNSLWFASVGSISATGFSAWVRKWNNTADTVTATYYWIARA